MSAEDRQKYLTLLRDNFIREQRESLVFYVYYHDENYYGILSACTQLNANFLAKSNSILIDASEFEQLMMEVEESGDVVKEEKNTLWQEPDVVPLSWLDTPVAAPIVEEESLPPVNESPAQEIAVFEIPSLDGGFFQESMPEENSVVELPPVKTAEDPYALSSEDLAAIRATMPPFEEVPTTRPEIQQEQAFSAPMQQEYLPQEETRPAKYVAPVETPQVQQQFIPVDIEKKPIHHAETLQETQRKALEVRQNSIELREQALRQREKAVNDWERSLNAREAESDALQDTFNIRKQAMAQKEQRLVSMEEEVLFNSNALEDSFAKLEEAKKEARRVLG